MSTEPLQVISAVELPAAVYDDLETQIIAAMKGQLFDAWIQLFRRGHSIEYGGIQLLRSPTARVLR